MNLLPVIPILVVLFEYTAIKSAWAFAKFANDFNPPAVGILGGIINIGGNLPYKAIPHTVVTLHMAALVISIIYLVYFMTVRVPSPEKEKKQVPPQHR